VRHSPGCLFSVYAFTHNLRFVYVPLSCDAGELLAGRARSLCGVASPDRDETVLSTILKIYRLESLRRRKRHSMRERQIVQLTYPTESVDNRGKTHEQRVQRFLISPRPS
jgi:hypothetical protein